MQRILSGPMTVIATLAAFGAVGVSPASAQDAIEDEPYAAEDDGMDWGWIGLLGLLGLAGLKKRDTHTHTHTDTTPRTPPPRV